MSGRSTMSRCVRVGCGLVVTRRKRQSQEAEAHALVAALPRLAPLAEIGRIVDTYLAQRLTQRKVRVREAPFAMS